MIPLQGGRLGMGGTRVPGYSSPRGDETFEADWDVVSPDFFTTLGVALPSGRSFTDDDRDGRPFVAIVNEAFAARAWPGARRWARSSTRRRAATSSIAR